VRYYVIAGEASGDLHASNLIREIKRRDPDAVIRAWGGDLMEQAGAEIVKHYRDLAFMGFVEVVANLRTILRNIRFCKDDISQFRPDAVILVDYPGFNLRIAEFAKAAGIKVFYYISPQVWAWKKSRVKKIKRDVDRMYVILPFEKEFYQRYEYDVEFVGHPLLDAIEQRNKERNMSGPQQGTHLSNDRKLIAILPGSRKQEISVMLPVMLKMVKEFSDHRFVVAAAPSVDAGFYKEMIGDLPVDVWSGRTYEILESAHAAMVTSGTATLETALFRVPEVVCYKGNAVSYQIAKRLVDVGFISLVNLVMEQEVVKELIQSEFNIRNLKTEMDRILNDDKYRKNMLINYQTLAEKLGGDGASSRVAEHMIGEMKNGV
jgi:lipid-A-disaccharide synthase